MANVQLENGYTKIANKLLEQMAKIKLSATQYRIVMVVWRYTYGFGRKMHELSISFICEATGCSKRQIERDLKDLFLRKILLQQTQKGKVSLIGFNKNFDEWVEEKITTDKNDGSKQDTTTDIYDGSQSKQTTDTDDGCTTDIYDGTPPTDLTDVLPSSMTDKKESIKENLKEKDLPPPQARTGMDTIVAFYEENKFTPLEDDGTMPGLIQHKIQLWIDNGCFEEPEDIILMALEESLLSGARLWKFTAKILQRWQTENLRTAAAIEAAEIEFQESKKQKVVPIRKGERNEKHTRAPQKRKYDISQW